jgi:hypothetical protein
VPIAPIDFLKIPALVTRKVKKIKFLHTKYVLNKVIGHKTYPRRYERLLKGRKPDLFVEAVVPGPTCIASPG